MYIGKYSWFLAALKHEANRQYFRQRKALAQEAGISEAYLSMVWNEKSRASPTLQEKLAEVLGYDYMSLMELGRSLVEGDSGDVKPKRPLSMVEQEKLRIIIEKVEQILDKKGVVLSPQKKAALIMLMYKKKEFEAAQIEELMPLISEDV